MILFICALKAQNYKFYKCVKIGVQMEQAISDIQKESSLCFF